MLLKLLSSGSTGRVADYGAAKLPVLPLLRSFKSTQQQMILYALGFTLWVMALPVLGYAGLGFAIPVALSCFWWLRALMKPVQSVDAQARHQWGRQVFVGSIWCVLAMSVGALIQLGWVLIRLSS